MNNRIPKIFQHPQSMIDQNQLGVSRITTVYHHTMEAALYQYLKIKIHPCILSFLGKTIIVRGHYERMKSSAIF